MFGAKVKITRFIDDIPQPGIVECELNDAFGATHKFIDKVPIFYSDHLDEGSSYPVEGVINFEIVEKKAETSIVTTELPWHVESIESKTEFEILNSKIIEFSATTSEGMSVQIGQRQYLLVDKASIDISIPLKFDSSQPNAYGVEPASANACEYGELVGDTRRGGSCNFERVTFIPHCNGTHTECVGHITNERISVRECLVDVMTPAVLVSVEPEQIGNGDLVIRKEALNIVVTSPLAYARSSALIVRTLPNDERKLSNIYDENNIPPYFTTEAMQFIVECGFKHLLVDMPSIDRLFDEGKLSNHRIFWNVEQGSFELNPQTRKHSTITELIYVPSDVADGEYLLNLQIAPFESDATPSRPILLKQ